jgi:hypothetical protein
MTRAHAAKMVYHCGITCPISPAGSTGQEFSDEQTFSYCNSLSHIHVPAGRRLAGPKHAEYRYTGGYHACTGNYHNHAGARYATGSCARLDAHNHDRQGRRNNEKEACKKDDPKAGGR